MGGCRAGYARSDNEDVFRFLPFGCLWKCKPGFVGFAFGLRDGFGLLGNVVEVFVQAAGA